MLSRRAIKAMTCHDWSRTHDLHRWDGWAGHRRWRWEWVIWGQLMEDLTEWLHGHCWYWYYMVCILQIANEVSLAYENLFEHELSLHVPLSAMALFMFLMCILHTSTTFFNCFWNVRPGHVKRWGHVRPFSWAFASTHMHVHSPVVYMTIHSASLPLPPWLKIVASLLVR
jgi:hypothetical protein